MELPQSLNLYITFIEKEGPFLKVWGQTEKNNAIYVEQFLSGISLQFNAGLSKVSPESLQCGTLVCAKYADNKYYRARILNVFISESIVEVTFIDFGNRHIISCENIRSLQDCPSSFISIPPLAIGFIFAEAHCVGGGEWNDTIFESISKEFRFREVQCHLLSQATQYYLVKLYLDTTDLCNLLIQRGLMQPISLQAQQAVLLSMSIQRQTAQVPAPTQTAAAAAAINTYKAVTLEPGCLYPVYVSYINDGPCHFSVQLKQSEDILAKLMKDINCVTLRLLEDVPIPGTLCLARCQEDGNVCRAVVTNEVDNQFKVYYVDFGNYEIVSLDSLFQIPFKYVIPKVMAIRYSLAGVEKSTVTIEMQVAFKKFVDNRMLHMKVLPTLTRVAVPKCELWDPENKTSALEVVNRAAQHAYPEPIPLNRGFSQPVKVSFVYSCNRFYVQLVSKEKELSNLMSELQEICQTINPIEAGDIKTGLPCCALFLADSLWYRSQVVEVLGETVKVRYIDYGNEEEVHINLLKGIDGEQLTVLRPQAIECCLNGYQNMGDDPERDGFLEEIILEDTFTMKVVEMVGKKVLVELFDLSNYNVASLLLDKIAAAKSQVSPMLVQAGNKIEHRKSVSQQRDGQTTHREGYSQHREGQRDDYRADRDNKTGRDESNWNGKPNDRGEKSWRQDNRGNRNFDKNSNDNDDRNSWRDNNKGFSPNNQRQIRQRSQEGDSWNTSNNNANSNSDWETTETNKSNANTLVNDEWNTPSNDDGSRQNRRQDDYGKNRRGFDNDRASKYDNDRGSKFDNDRGSKFDNDKGDRYGGKKWEGGYGKKPDFRKDDSQLSPNGSENSYHKGPRTSSRNDRGGRGGKFERNYDKPRGASFNSNTNNSIGEDSWNVSAVVPSIDAAPASAAFTPLEVIGTEAKVIISWFHHPCHFFCQIADSQDQFKVMMEEIQEFYKNRKPEKSVVGAPIIGLFPEDNVLYRAQVLEIIGGSYKVYYVDFGNVSTIQKVWPIDMKFMKLPAQAIVCSLNGLAPLGDNWSDPDSFSKYFEKEHFTCCFINKDEEKTYVNILYESEDIAQLLIRDGLAVSTLSTIPDIEIPMLLNQQFRAVLKSVNNLSDIIIALECGLAVGCTMHNLETATETFEDQLRGLLEQTVIVYVDNVIDDRLEITLYDTEGYKIVVLNPDEGAIDSVELPCPMLVLRSTIAGYVPHAEQSTVFIQPLEYAEIVEYLLEQLFATYNELPQECPICPEEGLLYAVHSVDGNWYRGRVVSCDDEKATVCFVDYGNSEDVAFSELRELASAFLEISFLSIQVTVSSDATAFIDKEVAGNIVYGEEGWEGTFDIIESSATESAEVENFGDTGYTTSSLDKPTDVLDNNIADENVLEDSHRIPDVDGLGPQDETTVPNVDETVEIENVVPVIEDGEAQHHLDKEAEVGSVVATLEEGEKQQHPDEVAEVATFEDKEIQQDSNEAAEIIDVVPAVKDGEIQQHLDEEAAVEKVAVATVKDGEMEQHLDGEAEVENAVQAIEDGEIQQHFDESVAMGTPVYTSHIDTPNEFYVQFHDAVSEIDELQEGIQTGAAEWPVIENPAAGIICAAPYSGDQKWYRAVILDADDDITTVRFMDFGNTDVIDNKTTQIKMLPPNLLSLAVYATRCSLKLEPLDEEWSAGALAVFEELATAASVTAEFLDQNEKTNYVELYSDGVNVREELIRRKLATTSALTDETKPTGFVSHLNSPSEFWIQLENCVDELEWIAEQLSSAETFEELEDLAAGTLCAALFPEDTMWYRARILSNTVAGIELLFIDYGNSCTSSSLRQLPEDLVVTAPLAQKCSLQKPEGIPAWSPEAAAKFREISAEGQTIFTVKKISTGETSIVQLFVDEQDVSTMLLPETEEGYVKAVDGLDKLEIVKTDGEASEGSFQLEALSGQELGEEAERSFEQISEQGSTLFQIEFVGNNTVRLYLNGCDIRPQLGGIKTSYDSSSIEEDFHANEEVNVSTEQTENDDNKSNFIEDNVDVLDKLDSSIQHRADEDIPEIIDEMKIDSFEEPHSDTLPCPAASSPELVEEPVIVDQIEAVQSGHLEVDEKPTHITSTEEAESHYSVQDNSQCELAEASTQTDAGEYEQERISVIPVELEIVEFSKECSSVVSSPEVNSNQEQQNDETLQDSSLTINTDEFKPPTPTASPDGLEVSEPPKKSSIEDVTISSINLPEEPSNQESENDEIVQDSLQPSTIIQVSATSPENSMLEVSTEKSSPVEDFVVQNDEALNNIERDSQTPTASLEGSVVEESPNKSFSVEDFTVSSLVKSPVGSDQNDDTVHDSFQALDNNGYEPYSSSARPEESVIEDTQKDLSPVGDNDDTVGDSVQALDTNGYEPYSSSARPKESMVEEHQKEPSPVEDNAASAVESPIANSTHEIQNDDAVEDSFQALDTNGYEPYSSSARPEESVVEENQKEPSQIEDNAASAVESPIANSNHEIQNDDTVEDSFQTLDIYGLTPNSFFARLKASVVEDTQKEPSPVGDNAASAVESPVTISNYEIQNEDTVEDSFQTFDIYGYEPYSFLARLKESVVEDTQKEPSPVGDDGASAVESPVAISNYEVQNEDTVEDSFQTFDIYGYEPYSFLARLKESVVGDTQKEPSPVGDNAASAIESPVAISNYEIQNEDTVEDSFQTLDIYGYEPYSFLARLKESVVEDTQKEPSPVGDNAASAIESPVAISNYEIQNEDTVEDSFQTFDITAFGVELPDYEIQNDTVENSIQTLDINRYEPHSSSARPEESVVQEIQKETSSVEDNVTSSVESIVVGSNYEIPNDDTVNDSFQPMDIIEYEPKESSPVEGSTASAVELSDYDDTLQGNSETLNSDEKSSVEEYLEKSNPVISRVRSPVASSNEELQNDNIVQDSFPVGDTSKCQISSASIEESAVNEFPKPSSVEDITASNVEEPVASSNQDIQIGDTVQDSSHSQESPKESSVPIIISPEVSSSSREDPSYSKPSPENASEGTEVKVSGCVEQQKLNEGHIVVLENDNAAPDSVQMSSDSGNGSYPTTPQKNVGVAAPANSPIGAQALDMQKCPGIYLFDNITIGSSRQDVQDNDDLQGGDSDMSQEGKSPNEIVENISFAGLSALEGSLEESSRDTLSEAVQIDASITDLDQTLKSTECENSSISLSSSKQVNDTVLDSFHTLNDNKSDDHYKTQEILEETKLSKLTISEHASEEASEGHLSEENGEKEKNIAIAAPVNECSITKPSETQLPESECEIPPSSSKKVKKSLPKPIVVTKNAKETSNKSSTVKVDPVPLVKSTIRVSLSVSKLLAAKKDEVSPPATVPKKSKQATSSKVTTVSKTLPKKTSVKDEPKSTQKKPSLVKTVASEPIKKTQSLKDDSPKRNAPVSSKKKSSNGANDPGMSKKGSSKKGGSDLAMLSKKSDEDISDSLKNKELETSELNTETENSKCKSKVLTEFVHNSEDETSFTNVLKSDQIRQDGNRKMERSEDESSSLHSDLKEIEPVENIEQEEN